MPPRTPPGPGREPDFEAIVARIGRDAALQALSGTTDKSSREWKNARDSLSRWRRGARAPGQASMERLRGAAEGRPPAPGPGAGQALPAGPPGGRAAPPPPSGAGGLDITRGYPQWDMNDQTKAELSAKLGDAVNSGLPPGADYEAIVARIGRDAVLEAMSGTTDRSSREWKNARDSLSRWRRGARAPGGASAARLRAAAEQGRLADIRRASRLHVHVSATFITSKNRWGYADADLIGSDLTDFLDARAAGNDELAMQIATEAYGLPPEVVLGIEGPVDFDLDWNDDSGQP